VAGLLAGGAAALAGVVLGTRTRKTGLFANLFGGGEKWSEKESDTCGASPRPGERELRLESPRLLEKNGNRTASSSASTTNCLSSSDDPRREELDRRWGELLYGYGANWFGRLKKLKLEPSIAGTSSPPRGCTTASSMR